MSQHVFTAAAVPAIQVALTAKALAFPCCYCFHCCPTCTMVFPQVAFSPAFVMTCGDVNPDPNTTTPLDCVGLLGPSYTLDWKKQYFTTPSTNDIDNALYCCVSTLAILHC